MKENSENPLDNSPNKRLNKTKTEYLRAWTIYK